ncbi:protein of unknown function [Pararobbsia alpina]
MVDGLAAMSLREMVREDRLRRSSFWLSQVSVLRSETDVEHGPSAGRIGSGRVSPVLQLVAEKRSPEFGLSKAVCRQRVLPTHFGQMLFSEPVSRSISGFSNRSVRKRPLAT